MYIYTVLVSFWKIDVLERLFFCTQQTNHFGTTPVMNLFDLERQYLKRELAAFSRDELAYEDVSKCVFRRRQFEMIRKSENSFLPYECIPTGGYTVSVSSEQSWTVRLDKSVELFDSYFKDPENFSNACALMGLSRSSVVFSDPEFPYGSIQYPSFDAAMDAVFGAIERNEVLVAWRAESDPDHESADVPLLAPHEHLLAEIGRWKRAMESEERYPALFYQTELFSSPVRSTKARILDYLNGPTLKKWESVRSLFVFKNRRVSEVVYLYDRSCSATPATLDESTCPAPEVLRNALSSAIRLHNADCLRRIDLLTKQLAMSGYGQYQLDSGFGSSWAQ